MHILCAKSRAASWGHDGLAGEIDARTAEAGIFYAETGGVSPYAPRSRTPSGDARELYMRWAETSAFSPLFCNGDSGPVQPWTDTGVLAHYCRMATIHTLLQEYHRDTLESFMREGYPPVSDPSAQCGNGQKATLGLKRYLYGRDLLIMPVSAPGVTFSRGVLPNDGSWIHLWTTREFTGGPVTVEALLGYPAVFFRADSKWASLFDKVRLEAKRTE